MDRTEEMICHHLYWHGIRNAVWKEGSNCDAFQRTKLSSKNMIDPVTGWFKITQYDDKIAI